MKTLLAAIILIVLLGNRPCALGANHRVPRINLHNPAFAQKPDLLPWLEPPIMPLHPLAPATPDDNRPELLREGEGSQNVSRPEGQRADTEDSGRNLESISRAQSVD